MIANDIVFNMRTPRFLDFAAAIWLATACAPGNAAEAQQWSYTEGPMRGSLRSDGPLPLYHADTNHLWNRLFAAFYIRPSELASPPAGYPSDPTKLDEFNRRARGGELPPGPKVKRIEGGDVLNLLAWPKTRHFTEKASFQRENRLLDEFLESGGERLIEDPLRRAFLQRDLWAVFDHLAGQNLARLGDVDLARRRAGIPDSEVDAEDLKDGGQAAIERRKILCEKLAAAIQRLALTKKAIESLPKTYASAVSAPYFSARGALDSRQNYLPPDLLTNPDEWVEIDTSPEPLRRDPREGQIDYVAWSIRGRSYYRIFVRFPEGRETVEAYLQYLQREGVDWEKSARQGFIALKPDVRQIPVGTEAAIVEFMVALDDQLEPVPTEVVESVRVSVYKNVTGAPDPATNTGRGLISRVYAMRRRLLFDGLKQGGLERLPDDGPTYTALLNGHQDWGISARQQTVVQSCIACHMHEKDRVGIFSLNTIFCFSPEMGMPGIVIPMGWGGIQTYSRAKRIVRWKVGQEDYAQLVEYARGLGKGR